MNRALNPVAAPVQSVLGVRITGPGECTHSGLMVDVLSKVTQQQTRDRARMELQFPGSSYDAFASGYYLLAFEKLMQNKF